MRVSRRTAVRVGALIVALVGGAVAVGAAMASGGASTESADPPPTRERAALVEDWIARTDDDALFTVDCPFSHRASDDPIVHPGVPGASHSHEFFGSRATDAASTGASLRGTATTCEDTDDTAAYWVPTLSVGGVPVEPSFLRAYYRARPGVDVRDVTAPPPGLAMISGDPRATGHDHGAGHDHGTGDAGWGCGLRPRQLHAEPPVDCTEGAPLTMQLRFPDCWDGRNLDSFDHRSHVARSADGACPATHPVLMTELQLSISWPVTGSDGAAVTLASGAVQGAHGDFLNGWEPSALAAHIDLCIHAKVNCTIG